MTARRRSVRRTVALAVTASVAALALTACGADGDDKASGSTGTATEAATGAGGHNAADVSFSKEMIQHHRQAVEMASLATDRAASTQVKTLATKIKGAQDPEIGTMSGWLTSWGEKVPQDMTGMGHDMSSSTPGMMTAADMGKLEKASGAAFDALFLDMMVEHHEGAVEMARTEKADGSYRPATALAAEVITAQSAEIEQMNKMLGKG
ncbi:DUF305 domain-containing protein [Streptomyces sp. NPDC091280]|uniref:DUF305 domain-containing protein n=1 Tax=Streptomyces sp. NPDC091280 TaxID=3365984 RepID=UPI003801DCB6